MPRPIAVQLHLHLLSDSSGETVTSVARAVVSQYPALRVIEHVHPLLRSDAALAAVLPEIVGVGGFVLYTLVSPALITRLEAFCRDRDIPCCSVLAPVQDLFRAHLPLAEDNRAGARHSLDALYFRRVAAMAFALAHDDGQRADDSDAADIVLLGVSRTSKTPTALYLANRGVKVANVPFVPAIPLPAGLLAATRPLVVGLVASPGRLAQIRRNRIDTLDDGASGPHDRGAIDPVYADRYAIAGEVIALRRLCQERGWPVIDVTRRAIEETAAEILTLFGRRAPPPA